MEFIPTSETARQEVLEYSLKELTDEQLKDELERRGFFTGNLWSVEDVKSRFLVSDGEAQDVLYKALTNEATMEQIWLAIDDCSDYEGYERIEDE